LFVILGVVALVIGLVTPAIALKPPPPAGPVQLAGKKIAQFVDPLPSLRVNNGTAIILEMKEFKSMVMPTGFVPAAGAYTGTYVWGYRYPGQADTPDPYIGPVIVATRGIPTEITFVNKLGNTSTSNLALTGFWKVSTDQTLHWADPANLGLPPKNPPGPLAHYDGPIPAVPHLHGGEVPPQLDGGPDAWFYDPSLQPAGYDIQGHAYYSKGNVTVNTAGNATYRYPNTQEGAPIWFHDHLLGATRLNVYAGLAGGYLIKDPPNDPANLPGLIPLVIQDRMFDTNGQLFFPNVGINPEHPYWVPEFVGDTIVVNGKVWPYQTVNRQRYSFLLLNGSNARTYDMFLQDQLSGASGPPMWVIGTDGGYLDKPVLIDPAATGQQKKAGVQTSLVMMPGERYTVIVDFNDPAWIARITAANGGILPATVNLLLRNTAKTPYPGGAPAIPGTTGKILQFRVSTAAPGADTTFNPAALGATLRGGAGQGPAIVRLPGAPLGPVGNNTNVQLKRQLTLNEVIGAGGPLEILVNNTLWDGTNPYPGAGGNIGNRTDFTPVTSNGETFYYTELPKEGETEVWEIVNLTADAHPIHLHLVQFQVVSRQPFDLKGYTAAYNAAFPGGTTLAGVVFPAGVYMPGYGPPKPYTPAIPGAVGGNPDVTLFLKGAAVPALPSEQGWKDTVMMNTGEVTRIVVRWSPTDLPNTTTVANAYYPFDPNGGHGYVWHCHIIDHEDNEMMRPTSVIANTNAVGNRTYILEVDY
jgi:FtsP/CotA-like multicopper oxidase with cupredoxin domain